MPKGKYRSRSNTFLAPRGFSQNNVVYPITDGANSRTSVIDVNDETIRRLKAEKEVLELEKNMLRSENKNLKDENLKLIMRNRNLERRLSTIILKKSDPMDMRLKGIKFKKKKVVKDERNGVE